MVKTADVLFAQDAAKVKALANQMEKIGLSNMKQADMDAIIAQIGDEAPLVEKLQALVGFQRVARDEQRSSALRKLQTGDLNPVMAAELIANRSTSATADIKKILMRLKAMKRRCKKYAAITWNGLYPTLETR